MATNDLAAVLARLAAQRKLLQARPPLPQVSLDSLFDDFALRQAHATTALEGNTLTLDEVQAVLERGITIPGKSLREHLEVLNAHDTWRWLRPLAQDGLPLTESLVLDVHRRLMQRILDDDALGVYRRVPVYIRGSWHVPPNWLKVPDLMASWLRQYGTAPGDEHPVAVAAQAHVDLVRLHPFVDGNGRTTRMLVNFLLMQQGYPPAHFAAEARDAYLGALRAFDQSQDVTPFVTVTTEAVGWMMDRWLALSDQVAPAGTSGTPVERLPDQPRLS